MTVTVEDQIRGADKVICENIAALHDQRELLSQNILAQLRNLVEGVAVGLHVGGVTAPFTYPAIKPAMSHVRSQAHLSFIGRFHKLLQGVASHYTLDGDASERLMLKYFGYLLRLRANVRAELSCDILSNLEQFPIDLDPSMREYHEKIAAVIEDVRTRPVGTDPGTRYYVHKTRPLFVGGRIYYEVTFSPAVNNVSKFDRVIAFTDIEMTSNYAAKLALHTASITVFDQDMPVTIIRRWQVSIRPCEFDNFARLLGIPTQVKSGSREYEFVNAGLTAGLRTLHDVIDMPEDEYQRLRSRGTASTHAPQIFPALDEARRIIRGGLPGHNLIAYLMHRMHNQILKPQYDRHGCDQLSGLRVKWACIPFDTMPLCTSPVGHNPPYWDLVESLDLTGRDHELLARRVKNNVEIHGILYTPQEDLAALGDVPTLIATYNDGLYYKHRARRGLELDKGHVVMRGYENDTVTIIENLQERAASGIAGHTVAVTQWLDKGPHGIDDPAKVEALKSLFERSRVALIYGAAGTGKSTLVNHIANYLNDKSKLFLAHTNPAKDNIQRKVTAQNATFRTIASHIYRTGEQYDVVIVDECSIVSNADMVEILTKTSFKLLVLVGDVHQLESIKFGNWFSIARSFIPPTSVFELTTPFRATDGTLLRFWDKLRNVEGDLHEVIATNGYSSDLDPALLEIHGDDEIILCLNYDGLYGINNINRFLQGSNPGQSTTHRATTYKVGDPVLFNQSERFRPVIYNNLKGWITAIEEFPERTQFDIRLDRTVTDLDVDGFQLEWVADSTVRFSVWTHDASDQDDDSNLTTIPFQVAYAVSIHKAQGLEYDSVKIVITDSNEDDITHSILYTAVTRTRSKLRIYWTAETQHAVLTNLRLTVGGKDVALLSSRRNLAPVIPIPPP